MKYPKYTDYEEMYKRFFSKGVDYMINVANVNENDKVLDVCGGNGRLTKELFKICPNVSYVDREADMIPKELSENGIKVYNQDIEDFVRMSDEKYTKVFCEQAINYWLLNIDIKQFSNIISPGGLFIFNTFTVKPLSIPIIKTYSIQGTSYTEISYLVENKVEHVQIREGYPPHVTEFDWISEEQFKEILSPFFNVELLENGKSALYRCRRK